jgi:hypothetical protein
MNGGGSRILITNNVTFTFLCSAFLIRWEYDTYGEAKTGILDVMTCIISVMSGVIGFAQVMIFMRQIF